MTVTAKTKDLNSMYTRLRDTQFSLYENYARKRGLQSKSLLILLWLYHTPGGISQHSIAMRTYSTKQVVNATVKSFARKGYIAVTASAEDKRKKLLTLTDTGRDFAASVIEPMDKAEEKALARLTAEQQETLVQTTALFAEKLTEELMLLANRKD